MTDNAADPTGVFITGPTGFGKTALAREFAAGARDSKAKVYVIDVVKGGSDFPDAAVVADLKDAVSTLRDASSQFAPGDPIVLIFDELDATLRREDRAAAASDEDRRGIDRRNRQRDAVADLIADSFVFGAKLGVFPVIVGQSVSGSPFIGRVQQASTGWAHFEFTSHGKGVLHTERGDEPFTFTPRSTAS